MALRKQLAARLLDCEYVQNILIIKACSYLYECPMNDLRQP